MPRPSSSLARPAGITADAGLRLHRLLRLPEAPFAAVAARSGEGGEGRLGQPEQPAKSEPSVGGDRRGSGECGGRSGHMSSWGDGHDRATVMWGGGGSTTSALRCRRSPRVNASYDALACSSAWRLVLGRQATCMRSCATLTRSSPGRIGRSQIRQTASSVPNESSLGHSVIGVGISAASRIGKHLV